MKDREGGGRGRERERETLPFPLAPLFRVITFAYAAEISLSVLLFFYNRSFLMRVFPVSSTAPRARPASIYAPGGMKATSNFAATEIISKLRENMNVAASIREQVTAPHLASPAA